MTDEDKSFILKRTGFGVVFEVKYVRRLNGSILHVFQGNDSATRTYASKDNLVELEPFLVSMIDSISLLSRIVMACKANNPILI